MEDKQMQQLLDKLDDLDHKLDVIDAMVGCMDELKSSPMPRPCLAHASPKTCPRLAQDLPKTCTWISVEDALPEIDIDVIVFYPYWKDKPIQVAHLNYDKLTFELSDGEFNFPASAVTHWMPLPDAPEVSI